jgi:hypothetical protein
VLAFLSSWTAQLHADGYVSGVYSSAASGMQDLVAQVGTGYTEPDDIWIADWNGQRTTSDPYVPSGDWASHHRLHQYSGSHNETYGGVTINIDGDYLDGATAGANAAPVVAPFPSLSVKPGADGVIHLKARWYGVSGITAWRVLGGATPSELTPIGRSAKRGSQTSIAVHSSFPWFEVQALGSGGQTLGTSKPVVTPAFIAIYGRSVFVSRSGVGGVPAGCFTGKPCRVATTITAGRSVIARTGPQSIPAGGAGVLHYALSSGGRAMLARAAGHRLSVRVALRDASGITAANTLSLARFSTRGHGPRRSLHQGGPLRVVGTTHFVSGGSQGGILAGCFNSTPCRVTTTIVARHTVIARTGGEFLGAHELGYLTFKLTARGRALLAGASGNQLGVHLTLTAGTASAGGDIALVRAG